jgi:ribonuclease Z
LIHEATFEDELIKEAVLKRHSTTSEAIDVARRMNAAYTLLTHFSQRYPKVPIVDDSIYKNTGIAFDLMHVDLAEIHVVPHLLPALRALFGAELERLQEGLNDDDDQQAQPAKESN